jgi:hypothetical protein
MDLLEDVEIELRQAQETIIQRHINRHYGCLRFSYFK